MANQQLLRMQRLSGTTVSITEFFIYLQLLDLLTTLLGFKLGASEASPFIRTLTRFGPVAGLTISKVLAVGLAVFCIYTRRPRVLRWASYWYSLLVAWNLVIIAAVSRRLS